MGKTKKIFLHPLSVFQSVIAGSPDHMRDEKTDSDTSSTAYSNFTYWRLREEDTYRALPVSPDKEVIMSYLVFLCAVMSEHLC